MAYIPVDGHPGLARNSNSGAIININSSEMSQARGRKKIWQRQQNEIKNLKSDVSEMKVMLQKLIEEKDGSHSN